ncbi:hypothetical protein Glove_541g7 [Diversispora epigaea]|uniref:Uncharacterized protein n=1 Tax=Diversispora epigaea TaxID=1348612 RepID=A0A397GGL4_9GLOM|nr:hypothetical protein Glove_541g7 [Diversispora epigaea]
MQQKAEKKGDRPWNNSKNESAAKQSQNLKLPILNNIWYDSFEYHLANIQSAAIKKALIEDGFHEEKDNNDDDNNNMNEIETNDDNDIIVNIDSGNLKEKSVSCIISNRKKKYFHLTLDEAV